MALVATALLLGCPGRSSSVTPSIRATTPSTGQQTAGFVIYTEERTTVVPVTPDVEIATTHGYWLSNLEDPTRVERFTTTPQEAPAAWGLSECDCKTGCSDVGQIVDMRAGTITSDCPCFVGPASLEAEFPRHPDSAFRAGRIPCSVPSESVGATASVVGGRLYATSSGSSMIDACGFDTGYNVYDSTGADTALIEGAPPAPTVDRSAWQICMDFIDGAAVVELVYNNYECRMDGQTDPTLEPDPADDPDVGDQDALDDEAAEMSGYGACDSICEEADAAYPVIASSHLCWIAESTNAVGSESHSAYCRPLTAENCPSRYDPCGPVGRFELVIGSDPWDSAHWISTDGRYALIGSGVYGTELDEDGAPALIREHDVASTEIVGVSFLPNVQPLIQAIARFGEETPAVGPPEVLCDESNACPGLMRCHPEGRCYAPCTEDDDCSDAGLCGAACEDGMCGAVPTSDCRDTACAEGYFCMEDDTLVGGLEGSCVDCTRNEHCAPGGLCDGGVCGGCEGDADCPNGTCEAHACVPSGCPRGDAPALGNACYRALQAAPTGAGEDAALAAAMRLCECALTRSPADPTRGAVLYNVGRILERWGAHQTAIEAYEQSLRARPRNEATMTRLSRLR